ncbi:glycoside hydrolase family 3 C-terminal domain-containing protein [Streptomyces sp. bgisy100]|uniref:beta-glucosidase n=1 Tax=Streptomyces sp. bgisy100 TaxID=3413783 RepID=UPI003D726BD0
MTPQDAAREAAVEDALGKLDLDDRTRLLAGQDTWSLPALPAIGLRSLVMSDGPVGVRGVRWTAADPSVALPSPTALAATWDPELARRAGHLLAQEARRKGVHVLLAPTVNLHRSPLGGRHFECYSEDPHLTGEIGTGYVRGVQEGGVGTAVKHFVANDAETERFTVTNTVAPRPLRELYLAPFEVIVRNARPWGVMAAYNAVNGTAMTSHRTLLREVLREEWGFDGAVVSDWLAARSTVDNIRGGLDIAMPGPRTVYGAALADAVRAGEVEEAEVDRAVRQVLRLAARVGVLDGVPAAVAPQDLPERLSGEDVAREIARRSFVLLRNEPAPVREPAGLAEEARSGPHSLEVPGQEPADATGGRPADVADGEKRARATGPHSTDPAADGPADTAGQRPAHTTGVARPGVPVDGGSGIPGDGPADGAASVSPGPDSPSSDGAASVSPGPDSPSSDGAASVSPGPDSPSSDGAASDSTGSDSPASDAPGNGAASPAAEAPGERPAEPVLPLDLSRLRSVAVIGAAARDARILGGGSAQVFPAHVVSPLDGLRDALPREVEVVHAVGADPSDELAVAEKGFRLHAVCRDGQGRELGGEPLPGGQVSWMGDLPDGVDCQALHTVELSGTFTPRVNGEHLFGTQGIGGFQLTVNGQVLFDGAQAPGHDDPFEAFFGSPMPRGELYLKAGQPVEVELVCTVVKPTDTPVAAVSCALLHGEPVRDPDEMLDEAATAAADADTAIVIVATTERVESEGFDRTHLLLPGRQDELVRRVAAVNPRTVVVVNSGSPVELPWREDVAAVLLGWFPGQEAGAALADVLLGREEPGGRLPTTWPARLADAPVSRVVPTDGELVYEEGVFIGYRAWEKAGATPAYPFGHGLGYTTWEYEAVETAGTTVTVRLRNTGTRPGREVVQIYLTPPAPDPVETGASEAHPEPRRLAGFATVAAATGESVAAEVVLPRRAFETWDEATDRWRFVPGRYRIEAGRSATDPRLTGTLDATD